MKKYLPAAALAAAFLSPAASHAGPEDNADARTDAKNIHRGHYRTASTVSLSQSGADDETKTTRFRLDAFGERFVRDRLSVGGSVLGRLAHVPGTTTIAAGLGPSATWYFLERERLATYVHLGAQFVRQFGDLAHNYYSVAPSIGLAYFITPSTAFGPELRWTHDFGNKAHRAFDDYGFVVGFSVYI